MLDENDVKELDLAIAKMNQKYGQNSIAYLGDQDYEPWPAISTGALSLDMKLGIGGLPRGRFTEIYGPESAGKSTLSMSVVAEAQKQGGRCAYIDVEHAVDPFYCKYGIGVDMENLLFSQPSSGEEAMEIARTLVKTGKIDVIVVDSVAALVPEKELEGEIGDSHVGLLPRMMSQAMRMLEGPVAETNTVFIFTNQLRSQIGPGMNPDTTPGGKALRYAASVRIDLRKDYTQKSLITDKDGEPTGVKVLAKIVKNKTSRPLQEARFDILFGRGINKLGCIIDVAVEKGLLVKSSSWIKNPDGTPFAQGREKAIEKLASDLEIAEKLVQEIKNAGL